MIANIDRLHTASHYLLRRWGLPAALGLAVAYAAFYLVLHPYPGFPYSMDFTSWWMSGRIILDGRSSQLFDVPTQMAYQRAYAQDLFEAHAGLPFNRPPVYAIPLIALALLPLVPAYAVWSLILVAETGLALWLIVTRVYPGIPAGRGVWMELARAAVLSLAFFPLFMGLVLGQTTSLELLLLTGFYLLYRDGKDGQAGGLLGLAAFVKPQMALFFVPLLLMRPSRRGLAGLALAGAACGLVSLLMVGLEGLLAYSRLLSTLYSSYCVFGVYPEQYQAWRGLVVGQLVPGCVEMAERGLSAADLGPLLVRADLIANGLNAVTIALWLAALWRNRAAAVGSGHFDVLFATTIVISLLAGPHTNPQDLTRLVLAAALFYRARRATPGLLPGALASAELLGASLVLGPVATGSTLLYSSHPFVLLLATVTAVLLQRLFVYPPGMAKSEMR